MDAALFASLIAAIIIERPVCLACIATKVGATQLETRRAIERIGTKVRVTVVGDSRCRICGSTVGPVYSLDRPD